MYHYSKKSLNNLNSCHIDIQIIFKEVIKYFDNTILYGHRTPDEQYKLYQQGRTIEGDIVTYKDGVTNLSKHNYYPSLAVDAIPYFKNKPNIRWNDNETLYYFSGFVFGIASLLYDEGKIKHKLRTGVDWDNDNNVNDESFIDLVHFELIT